MEYESSSVKKRFQANFPHFSLKFLKALFPNRVDKHFAEAFLEAVLDVSVDHPANHKSKVSGPADKNQEKFTYPDTTRAIEIESQSEDLTDQYADCCSSLLRRRLIFIFVQHNFFSHVYFIYLSFVRITLFCKFKRFFQISRKISVFSLLLAL